MVNRQSLQPRMLDEATMKRDSAKAELAAASAAITAAYADVTVESAKETAAKANAKAVRADTEVAATQLKEMGVMIRYATLKAPFAGVVTQRQIDIGDLVDSASNSGDRNPLMVLHQIDKVRVHIPVPESDAVMVSRGDAITLTFPSFTGETINASVTRVTQSLDPQTRTMMVEAEIENVDGKLMPGMFGQATIALGNKIAANMLPARSVRFDGTGNAFVYVVNEDETVEVVAIETGIDDGRSIEVVSGVGAGARVVDANLTRLTTGQKVKLLAD
jgi:RND family efflux transporter MFP subunit